MVAVDDPDPPQEAKIETESMGVLRAHTVVVHRLANELFHIEELHLRVQQGCELDAAQREKLGREDELLTALEAAIAVAEAAFAVPQTGPGSPEKREVQSALDAQRPQQIEPKSPQQPRVEKTHKTRPRSQCKHKESVPLVQRPQIGPNSQHKEQSAHVQQPQQPRVAETQIGPESPCEHEEQSALVQRPQMPSVAGTQIGPMSQCEREQQSALAQRPQMPSVAGTQIGPVGPREREQQSALVRRPQMPHVAETQIRPESPREREEQSALVQRQQPHAAEAQPKPKPKPREPEPRKPEPQSGPGPKQPQPQTQPKPKEPEELRVEQTPEKNFMGIALNTIALSDAEPDHWKPGGFEPQVFDPGGSTGTTVRKPAHKACSHLRVRLRLRGDG
jgi:hypothetical protein